MGLPGLGKPDCYCVATRGGTELHKTKTIKDSLTPHWAEEFDVFDYNDGEELEFKVWDSDVIGADYLGKVVLKQEQFMVNGLNGDFEMAEAGKNITAYLGLKIKMPGQEYPLEPATELEVIVEKGEHMNYGIRIDEQGKVDLQVLQVEQGAVQKYNESAKADMQVKKSDFILSVNGINGNCEEMMKQFDESKITLKLSRPLNFAVILDKEDQTRKLGIVVPPLPKNGLIPVLRVEDGLIKDYNDKCTKESDKILVLDRIVSVKGEVGSAAQLQALLNTSTGKFQVGMQRPHTRHIKATPRTG